MDEEGVGVGEEEEQEEDRKWVSPGGSHSKSIERTFGMEILIQSP